MSKRSKKEDSESLETVKVNAAKAAEAFGEFSEKSGEEPPTPEEIAADLQISGELSPEKQAEALIEIQGAGDEVAAQDVARESLEDYALPTEIPDAMGKSILESLLFASNQPLSFAMLRGVFHGTNINSDKLRELLDHLGTDYAGGDRGICLEEVAGGYQLRTKLDNANWLRRMVKSRPFKLSGPALEVLSIIAYKQPVTKHEVDEIRGVESGHLVRALMEKNIVRFSGKSELPGKPMLYATTKEFLELFGLRNIRELPTLNEIDDLIPEGIGSLDEVGEKETLGSLAEKVGLPAGKSYSESESELLSITEDLALISTSTEFFEQEKVRQRQQRDNDRAQDLRERKIMGEVLSEVDEKWLSRFEKRIDSIATGAPPQVEEVVDSPPSGPPSEPPTPESTV